MLAKAVKRQIQIVFIFQAITLLVFGWLFRHALNTDAVAYLQLAKHYADGDFSLAISGHWSPLISWTVALLLKAGLPPLIAAHCFMIFSGVFFLWGSLRLFRQFNLSEPLLVCGLWTLALLSIPWSVENITPDLLLAGLVGLAVSKMVTPAWFQKNSSAFACGTIWGLAFLCKSAALPLGILAVIAGALWWWKNNFHDRLKIIQSLGLVLTGISIVSAVWIGVLTSHYGKLTVANSASYNHSLVGPAVGQPLFLLDHGLQAPPADRVTIWEDPSAPYPDWSAFSSLENAKLQWKIILRNVPIVLVMLTSVSLIFPVVVVFSALRLLRHRVAAGGGQFFWLALMPVIFLAALFLPNYLLITEQRYFYAAAPLLFVVAAQWGRWKSQRLLLLLALSFLVPNFVRAGWHLDSTRAAGGCAEVLAQKISQSHLAGSVVGSGKMSGGRTGLYVAYLLQQPWFGDEPSPAASDYKASGADLIVVNRGTAIANELAADSGVQNLDRNLFGSAREGEYFPIQIFQVRR